MSAQLLLLRCKPQHSEEQMGDPPASWTALLPRLGSQRPHPLLSSCNLTVSLQPRSQPLILESRSPQFLQLRCSPHKSEEQRPHATPKAKQVAWSLAPNPVRDPYWIRLCQPLQIQAQKTRKPKRRQKWRNKTLIKQRQTQKAALRPISILNPDA